MLLVLFGVVVRYCYRKDSPPKDFRLLRSVSSTSSLRLILVGEEVRRSSVPPLLRTLSSGSSPLSGMISMTIASDKCIPF